MQNIGSKDKYLCDGLYGKSRHNRGSATIEMTLLIPIILGVFYLYISIFLSFVDCADSMEDMIEVLYMEDTDSQASEVQKRGSKSSVCDYKSTKFLEKNLEFHRYNGSVVENIRRWQLAADTVLPGGNP